MKEGETQDVIVNYVAKDGNGEYASSTATIKIKGVSITANEDHYTTYASEDLTLDVLSNDKQTLGAALSLETQATAFYNEATAKNDYYYGLKNTSNYTVSLADNKIVFNPTNFQYLKAGESADVKVQYLVKDSNGEMATANANITVKGVSINATSDKFSIIAGESADFDVLNNDTHSLNAALLLDGQAGSFYNEALNKNDYYYGLSGNYAYTVGLDNNKIVFDAKNYQYLKEGETTDVKVQYLVKDSHGEAATADAIVTVVGVDAKANADEYTIQEGETLLLDVLANDVASLPNRQLVLTSVVGNTAIPVEYKIVDNKIQLFIPATYNLDLGETRELNLAYAIKDSAGEVSNTIAKVIIEGTGVNAIDDTAEMTENGYLAIDVLANDIYAANKPVSILNPYNNTQYKIENNKIIIDWREGGKSPFEYLQAGQDGNYQLHYAITDGVEQDIATVNVKIKGQDEPIANPDRAEVIRGNTTTIDVLANDNLISANGKTNIISAEVIKQYYNFSSWYYFYDAIGSVKIVDNKLVYSADNYHLSDYSYYFKDNPPKVTIRYTIQDEKGGYNYSYAEVKVNPIPDPQVIEDKVTIQENNSGEFDVLANDIHDPAIQLQIADDWRSSLSLSSEQVSGDLGKAYVKDGKIFYDPSGSFAFDSLQPGESAEVIINYSVIPKSDIYSGTYIPGKLTVTVVAQSDPVVATEEVTIKENDTNIVVDVLANDKLLNPNANLRIENVSSELTVPPLFPLPNTPTTTLNPSASPFVTVIDNKIVLAPRYQIGLNYLQPNESLMTKIHYDVVDEKRGENTR